MADFGLPFVSSTFSRVTNTLARDVAMANLTRLQAALLRTQTEASSGKRINAPSDDPIGATIVLNFRKRVVRNTQFLRNIQDANGRLATADKALGQAQGILDRARAILLSQAQDTANGESRRGAAVEIDALIAEARDIANTRFENRFLFAGGRQTERPFTDVPGGVAYLGDDAPPRMNLSDGGAVPIGVSGVRAFAGFSAAIAGNADMDPDIALATKLSELNRGRGVRLGSIAVGTSAATLRTIDLRIAEDVGDVVNLINAQTASTGITAALNPAGNGLRLTGAAVLVQEVDGGKTALDLGLPNLGAPAGSPLDGADLDPVMAQDTPLALLNGGAGLDLSGLVISNATASQTFTATLSFAGLSTVGDVLNRINTSGVFVQAEINADGTGMNLRTRIGGARLTVAENGGATAAQLGVINANPLGLPTGAGPDIQIQTHDGTLVPVDLSGALTLQDVVAAINAAAPPLTVTASVGAANQLVLNDASAGAALFQATNLNPSLTATALGIFQSTAGNTILGTNPTSLGRAQVADLNNGLGIETVDGDDIQIQRHDGTTFEVDLSNAATVQDIVDAINNDSQNLPGPSQVVASLGFANNLVLTDPTAGASSFEVRNFNDSQTATQLGIQQSAASPTATLAGANLNWAGDQAEGLFTALIRLRDALRADRADVVRHAGLLLDQSQRQVQESRAEVGGSVARFELTQGRLEDERDQVQELRSGVEDIDLAEVATRLQSQQTTLQAALAVTARLLQTTLLNFL